jgi:hypothetical protein
MSETLYIGSFPRSLQTVEAVRAGTQPTGGNRQVPANLRFFPQDVI